MIFLTLFFLLLINTIIEFLPISSTAHFLIFSSFFNIDNVDIILSFSQLAMVFYLMFYFRRDLLNIVLNINKKEQIIFCFKIFLTMLPTILFGLIGYGFIKMYFYHGLSIAVFLLFGSIIMFLAERFYTKSQKKFNSFYDVSYGSCFRIGLLQMFCACRTTMHSNP